ncbi:outer membrane protein assembly factor BamD [Trichloromonas sp.]|uniref:outer membrane protein assembly factor BamD n=1 Tax=Trichloromonas sp. TaxID=3069249 RepID=UPI003D813532
MKNLFAAFVVLLLATACASTVVPPPKTADHYLQEGETFFEQGLYDDAIANWEKVRDSYYSPELNTLAEMKIAEAYFLSERYIEAATAYEDFLKQHPNHPRTAELLNQLGLSYYNQILTPDRDQTATKNALVTFNDLLKRFPDYPRQYELKEKIAQCQDRLAEHEMIVGNFYLRTEKYQAAVNRISPIFNRYPDYSKKDEAYYYLGHAYLMLENRQQAANAFNILYREYPSSKYVLAAQKLVEKEY